MGSRMYLGGGDAESGEESLQTEESPAPARGRMLTRAGPYVFPTSEDEDGQSSEEEEPVLKTPAGRGRGLGRGRGRGRGEPKAKAKAKAKAKTKGKDKAKKDADQTGQDAANKPKRGRPPADKSDVAASFARRVRPATAPASSRWDAIVEVFRSTIKPEIKKNGIPVYCWEDHVWKSLVWSLFIFIYIYIGCMGFIKLTYAWGLCMYRVYIYIYIYRVHIGYTYIYVYIYIYIHIYIYIYRVRGGYRGVRKFSILHMKRLILTAYT